MSGVLLTAGVLFLMYLGYRASKKPVQLDQQLQEEVLYALELRAKNSHQHRAMTLQELENRIAFDRTSRAYHKGFTGGSALDEDYQRPSAEQLMRAVRSLCEQGRVKSPTSSTVYYVQ